MDTQKPVATQYSMLGTKMRFTKHRLLLVGVCLSAWTAHFQERLVAKYLPASQLNIEGRGQGFILVEETSGSSKFEAALLIRSHRIRCRYYAAFRSTSKLPDQEAEIYNLPDRGTSSAYHYAEASGCINVKRESDEDQPRINNEPGTRPSALRSPPLFFPPPKNPLFKKSTPSQHTHEKGASAAVPALPQRRETRLPSFAQLFDSSSNDVDKAIAESSSAQHHNPQNVNVVNRRAHAAIQHPVVTGPPESSSPRPNATKRKASLADTMHCPPHKVACIGLDSASVDSASIEELNTAFARPIFLQGSSHLITDRPGRWPSTLAPTTPGETVSVETTSANPIIGSISPSASSPPHNQTAAADARKSSGGSVAVPASVPKQTEMRTEVIKINFLDADGATVRNSTWSQCGDPEMFWNNALTAYPLLTREDLERSVLNIAVKRGLMWFADFRIMKPVHEDFDRLSTEVEKHYWRMMRIAGEILSMHRHQGLTVNVSLV
ncbi:uncharacterized protein AB675_455 [Cyphellophora attinorum]|uniref:Uncharacterized protein n=1 Tax=Cyphellophora attinorum TaxID=1664694 RepID=A0A0N0NSB6_9EURO|nr:uncharacterized protein AB675_455 [Phialophora attinorum]KPI46068.1 hypothetical protein AB675_455 [Phialophora attinorum]